MNKAINNTVFDSFPVLESERLIFRSFKQTDAEMLFKIRSDAEVLKYMDTEGHQSINDALTMIAAIHQSFEEKNGINWVIEEKETGQMIGYIGFWRMMKEHVRAEIGYALFPEFWGKGFMTESIKNTLAFGFNDLHLHSVEANINPKNESSKIVLEKMGFKKEAHFRENYYFDGRFYDSIIYSLLETDFSLNA